MTSKEMYENIQYDSQKMGPGYPTMWLIEIACIERLLEDQARDKESINVLEYGSGNSTIYFPKFLNEKGIRFTWYAIENSIPWHEQTVSAIGSNGLEENVKCLLKNPTYETDKDVQETLDMSDYINFPSSLNTLFDVIIVDSRKRRECLGVASKLLAPGGVAILHDAEREEYHPAFSEFDDGGQFVCESKSPIPGGVQRLWVGRALRRIHGMDRHL